MTTGTDRIQAIFQDARELQADALELLAQGRIRNAAEKAWGGDEAGDERPGAGEAPERTPVGIRRTDPQGQAHRNV